MRVKSLRYRSLFCFVDQKRIHLKTNDKKFENISLLTNGRQQKNLFILQFSFCIFNQKKRNKNKRKNYYFCKYNFLSLLLVLSAIFNKYINAHMHSDLCQSVKSKINHKFLPANFSKTSWSSQANISIRLRAV